MFNKLLSILFLIFLCLKKVELKTLSWCDPKLCPKGVQHIACNNTGVTNFKYIN